MTMSMVDRLPSNKMRHREVTRKYSKSDDVISWFGLPRVDCCYQFLFLKSVLILVTVLLLSRSASASYQVDDLSGFINSVDDSIKSRGSENGGSSGISLMWGIPDTTAALGKLFQYSIPSDAFKGDIRKYEITEAGKNTLPSWLHFENITQQLMGLPTPLNIGQHYLEVVASDGSPSSAKDVFSITVTNDMGPTLFRPGKLPATKGLAQIVLCSHGEPETKVTVIIDTDLDNLMSKERVDVVKQLTSHLNLSSDMIKLFPIGNEPMFDSSALVAGPGDMKSPKFSGALATWLVGCGKVESDHMPILHKVESSALDGSMSEALGYSIVGWHVTNTRFQEKPRKKRAIQHTATQSLTMEPPTRLPSEIVIVEPTETDTEAKLTRSIPSMVTPVIQPTKTADVMDMKTEMVGPMETVRPDEITNGRPEIMLVTPSQTFTMPMTTTPTEILPSRTFVITTETTVEVKPTEMSSAPITTSTTDILKITTTEMAPPSDCPPGVKKIKPILKKPIGTLKFKAGELIKYRIPSETFFDCKEKTTANLRLDLFLGRTDLITEDFWLKFDSRRQVIIGLPLASDLGEHQFCLVAANQDGLSEMNSFVIIIEGEEDDFDRNINHEISLTVDIDYDKFMGDIQNRIDFSNKLARLYGDKNTKFVSVLRIDEGSVIYGWTNNSIDTDICPVAEIHNLVSKVITENGTLNPNVLKRMRPYKIVGASAVPHGECHRHQGFPAKDTSKIVITQTIPKVATKSPSPEPEPEPETTGEPEDSGESHGTSDDEIWITTVVPAVVIVAILIIALIIACVLYRKKRKGKMSLEDQDTFVNKGVPVIFADELDEKPTDSSKPLIMEEEKPPLPPPEYQRSESSRSTPEKNTNGNIEYEEHELEETDVTSPLYQPPPPVTSSGGNKQPRPHVQPAYRNPPPYVPP